MHLDIEHFNSQNNYTLMEEKQKSILSHSLSDWKLKQQSLRNQRNYNQLQNRLIILQMERQSKIKAIQHKLQNHKRMMQVKIDKFALKQEIQKHEKCITEENGQNSRVFQDLRKSRETNIKAKSILFKENNNKLFKDIKSKRKQNQDYIKHKSQQELIMKIQKRNRVRLIEIQSKQNVNKFWNQKLHDLKVKKQSQILSRLQMEQKKKQWILNMEKSELQLLKDIRQAEEMEGQLNTMMEEEKSAISAAIANKEQKPDQ